MRYEKQFKLKWLNSMALSIVIGLLNIGCTNNEDAKKTAREEGSDSYDIEMPFSTVPAAGIQFPTGLSDSGSGIIMKRYAIAKTEVTYELWHKVYTWAMQGVSSCVTSGAETGKNCYSFANAGQEGNDGVTGASPTAAKNEPVTKVSWRDAIIWCNAYTEYSNATHSTSFTVVYKKSGVILRNATVIADVDGLGTTFDPVTNTADGFRLPTTVEWELASRARKDSTNAVANNKPLGVTYPLESDGVNYWFTKGNSASGANSDSTNAAETGKMGWYNLNSGGQTHPVAGKDSNSLGLYDMSGNVWEWVFDEATASKRVARGAGYTSNQLQLGIAPGFSAGYTNSSIGFRSARTIN